MSKKQAKSERSTELPDWADEVTPADEVMKKFYAPTGAFKAGPIPVQAPTTNTATSLVKPVKEEVKEESVKTQSAPISSAEFGHDAPRADSAEQVSIVAKADASEANPLPPSFIGEINLTPARNKAATDAATKLPTVNDLQKHFEETQVIAFEEFVKKWRRYLYPGQLAVMRELYELTIARGGQDCFTRYSEIAAATKMTRRNCINVVNSLVERGFVERMEVRNDSTGKGIRLRIHTEPQP